MDGQNLALLFCLLHTYSGHIFCHPTNPYCYVYSLLYNAVFITHMVMGCIQEHHSVYLVQRAFLTSLYDRDYLVCDAASGTVLDVNTVKHPHMVPDATSSYPSCIHEDDFSLYVLADSILIFHDDLWFKLPISVPGDIRFHISMAGIHSFQGTFVMAVPDIFVTVRTRNAPIPLPE